MPAIIKRRYGEPIEGEALENWCVHAASDERDWYSAEDRYEAAILFARNMEQVRKREAPYKSIIVEGEPGTGKTFICNYYATLMASCYGNQTYADGTFGYGMTLSVEELLGAYNWLEKGATMFLDEANQFDRLGRDNSDIQEIRASHYQVVRKNQCTIINASANADRMSRGSRSRSDEYWHPEKLKVRYSEEAKRRLGRKGQGMGGRGRNNPAHFAYAVLKAKDRPHRPPSIFDAALGTQRDPKAGIPIYRKVLKISWMRKTAPLFDTFKKVPIGAALGVNREDVVALATGQAPSTVQGVSTNFLDTVSYLIGAFETGTLPKPTRQGGVYLPQYFRESELLAATNSPMGPGKFGGILRTDLGLATTKGKGYEINDVFEAVVNAWNDPDIQNLLVRQAMAQKAAEEERESQTRLWTSGSQVIPEV